MTNCKNNKKPLFIESLTEPEFQLQSNIRAEAPIRIRRADCVFWTSCFQWDVKDPQGNIQIDQFYLDFSKTTSIIHEVWWYGWFAAHFGPVLHDVLLWQPTRFQTYHNLSSIRWTYPKNPYLLGYWYDFSNAYTCYINYLFQLTPLVKG